ncbi:MAG: AAA family ATPase, partial [Myxococcota bacterium]
MRVDGDAPLIRDTRFRSTPSFVGRQADLELLEGCLHDALTGKPGVVLLSGDAGQGKTRLLHELESRAASEHFHVCRGRAHEDLSFPYLPFLDVLRSQISEVPEVVQRVLGPDAERIEALLRGESWSGFEEELEHGRGGRAGRMTLFTSVSRATVDLARIRPTLLVLDDLHWADGSTIEQLLHLVFAVADAMRRERIPLLVVASSRPPEPDGLLERAIARIEREDLCTSLALRGLGEDEVSELVAGLISAPPARHLVNELRTLTRGNPLFIQEVVDHLVDQEALSEQGGFVVLGRDVDDLELPRDLLSALEARAGTVSRQCRELLALAACLGDHFTLPILTALTKREEDDLLDDLEEAAAAHLLLWRDETFHFRHPLVRHVFYGMPNPARRQRVHRRIAAHLQAQYPAGASERALEIGHHLVRAGSLTPPDQGTRFAELAGDLSFGRCAWRDAARFYAAAAAAAARLEPPAPATVAKLHLRAGVAHYRNMDL